LYIINCCNFPLCICCHQNETVKHYLLLCPRFAAQHNELLTSAAQVCGKAWLTSNDNGKLEFLFNGSVQLSFDENCLLFGPTFYFGYLSLLLAMLCAFMYLVFSVTLSYFVCLFVCYLVYAESNGGIFINIAFTEPKI
jgi:hypothetical protein